MGGSSHMILYYLITTLYVLVCGLLLLVVLLQQGKGDIAAAFGGGSSQSAFGARASATVLSKATAVLAALFMLGALVLAIVGERGPGSVISGSAPPPPVSAPSAPTGAPSAPVTSAPPAAPTLRRAGRASTIGRDAACANAGTRSAAGGNAIERGRLTILAEVAELADAPA